MASKKRGLRPLSDHTYDVFMRLLKGEFKVPVKERTQEHRRDILHFWRVRKYLEIDVIDENEVLLHNGKRVHTTSGFRKAVLKESKASFGAGARGMHYKMKQQMAGGSERRIRHILHGNLKHSMANAKFTNKAPMKVMTTSKIFERLQIDLVDMKRDSVSYHGTVYKYIFSAMDCFSRYVFLRPLPDKRPTSIIVVLEALFLEHGYPSIIQCDNGTEFKGKFPSYLLKHGVRLIHSSPYHPQSQGKVERCHASLKAKLRFSLMNKRRGVNWVKELPRIASSLNDQPKEVLGFQSPHCVYYGRGSDATNIRRKAFLASARCASRMKNYKSSSTSCSIYFPGESVLMKFPIRPTRVPQKRSILIAKILKRNKGYNKYLLSFTDASGTRQKSWVSVEKITSLTREKEKRRRIESKKILLLKKKRDDHRRKYYIPISPQESHNDGEEYQSDEEPHIEERRKMFITDVEITRDPTSYGNCQFDAVSHQLSSLGIFRTAEQLRQLAVEHITNNSNLYVDFFRNEFYFQKYLTHMSRQTTFGDHFTLLAISREFFLQIFVVSKRGHGFHRIISNSGIFDVQLPLITLGHYPEGQGEHYVSVHIHNDLQRFISPFSPEPSSPLLSEDTPPLGSAENLQQQPPCSPEPTSPLLSEDTPPLGSAENLQQQPPCSPEPTSTLPSEDTPPLGFAENLQQQPSSSKEPTSTLPSEDTPPVGSAIQEDFPSPTRNELSPFPANYDFPVAYGAHQSLPDLVLECIIRHCVNMYPESLFRLQFVNRFFNRLIRSIGYPMIHISHNFMPNVPNPVCIRRLSRNFGIGSGLILRLREIIQDRRFINTWLELMDIGDGWFEIRNIFWR